MMFAIGSLTVIYVLIAAFAALMTYLEQQDRCVQSPLCKTLGFVACVFWPLTVLTVAVAVQRDAS